ncbi:hypothetical protein V1956_18920 [Yersinia sp. 2540 StPb PI]|uniref:hypothetical protein n=1 Tax=Yersinia sp. 2540 StPb PI TaxID=3117406 RepID=UPI003FA49C22
MPTGSFTIERSSTLIQNIFLVENNALSLPKGMADYGQSVASYAQYAQDKNLPPEQIQADLR